MTNLGQLYAINVKREHWRPAAYLPHMTRDQFNERNHLRLTIAAAVPDPSAHHTPQEILTAFQWAAGVMSRAAVELHEQLMDAAKWQDDSHYCDRIPDDRSSVWSLVGHGRLPTQRPGVLGRTHGKQPEHRPTGAQS
jgi:hypothetical protein